MLHARFLALKRLECLASLAEISPLVSKADAKARAKAEVDASCRDKTQAQALARLMLWSEKFPFEISRYFRVAVFLMCVDPMEQDTVSTPPRRAAVQKWKGVVAID